MDNNQRVVLNLLEEEAEEDDLVVLAVATAVAAYELQYAGPTLTKLDTNYRPSRPPGLRLAVTLYYMAHGGSYTVMQYGW